MVVCRYGIVIVLAAAALPFCLGTSGPREIQEAHGLLRETLTALKDTLAWFDKEYKHVNLDGIIGTRIIEGQLRVLLRHIDYNIDSYPLDGATLQEIRDVQALATQISNKALPFVQASDPAYYQKLNALIQENFWTLDFASKDFTNADLYNAWLPRDGEALHEEDSDNCISELLGTGPNNHNTCQISAGCWKMMTEKGYSGYSLTHQIFYIQIGYKMGCAQEMDEQRVLAGQAPPGEMVNMFCAAVYLEAKAIKQQGFPPLKQDLFMEQAALCGMMGFRWFFSPEWLETILQWQDKGTGCFKGRALLETQVDYRPELGVKRDVKRDVRTGRDLERDVKRDAKRDVKRDVRAERDLERDVKRDVRVKREERLLDQGCLCHRTTVAASALTMYVRYIVEFERMVFEKSQQQQQ